MASLPISRREETKKCATRCMLCGRGPVLAVMDAAKKLGADSVKILKYANSGDVPIGEKDRVVGYFAAAIYQKTGS